MITASAMRALAIRPTQTAICLRCLARQLSSSTPLISLITPSARASIHTYSAYTTPRKTPWRRLASASAQLTSTGRAQVKTTALLRYGYAQRRSKTHTARLTDRRLVAVHGRDAAVFLQGITTNSVPDPSSALAARRPGASTQASHSDASSAPDPATSNIADSTADRPGTLPSTPPPSRIQGAREGFYSAFLNAQGRILHDVFIYPAGHSSMYHASVPDAVRRKSGAGSNTSGGAPGGEAQTPAFLIEVDASGVQELVKHLKRYKLRSRVEVWAFDADPVRQGSGGSAATTAQEEAKLEVLAIWDDDPTAPSPPEHDIQTDIGCSTDPRHARLGARLVVPVPRPHSSSTNSTSTTEANSTLQAYTAHRQRHGIPAGPSEIPPTSALIHEYNLDLLSAVDFRKGCYVGQELVIRTQHKGVVRKRVLPVRLYDASSGGAPQNLEVVGDGEEGGDGGNREREGLVETVERWVSEDGQPPDIIPRGRKGRPAGRWVAGTAGNVGLALCRVEMMTDLVVSSEGGGVRWSAGDEFVLRRRRKDGEEKKDAGEEKWVEGEGQKDEGEGEIGIKAFVPKWVRRGVRVR